GELCRLLQRANNELDQRIRNHYAGFWKLGCRLVEADSFHCDRRAPHQRLRYTLSSSRSDAPKRQASLSGSAADEALAVAIHSNRHQGMGGVPSKTPCICRPRG